MLTSVFSMSLRMEMRSKGVESGEVRPSIHSSMVDSKSTVRDDMPLFGFEVPGPKRSFAVEYGRVGVLVEEDGCDMRGGDMLTRCLSFSRVRRSQGGESEQP